MSPGTSFCLLCDLCYSSSLSEVWKRQLLCPVRQNTTATSTVQKYLTTRLKTLFSSQIIQPAKFQRQNAEYQLGGAEYVHNIYKAYHKPSTVQPAD